MGEVPIKAFGEMQIVKSRFLRGSRENRMITENFVEPGGPCARRARDDERGQTPASANFPGVIAGNLKAGFEPAAGRNGGKRISGLCTGNPCWFLIWRVGFDVRIPVSKSKPVMSMPGRRLDH